MSFSEKYWSDSGRVNNETFIVFEAGPTHTGLESAIKLADAAKEAGADAIKFQITDHNNLIADKNLPFTYSILGENGAVEQITEPLWNIWERRWMPESDWSKVFSHCKKIGLDIFATVFSERDIDFVVSEGSSSLKIASQDTNYHSLIKYAATSMLPIQLDTGGSTIGEIERAVAWVLGEGNNQIIINHCPSGYPARYTSVHLNMIRSLKSCFKCPVAFSDHNPGRDMDIAAVAVGADIIEKTITLDRRQKSCEHMFSLEPHELANFVGSIRNVESAMGEPLRVLAAEEVRKRDMIRRSMHLTKSCKAGEPLRKSDYRFMRPGDGITPDQEYVLQGARLKSDKEAGAKITIADLDISS